MRWKVAKVFQCKYDSTGRTVYYFISYFLLFIWDPFGHNMHTLDQILLLFILWLLQKYLRKAWSLVKFSQFNTFLAKRVTHLVFSIESCFESESGTTTGTTFHSWKVMFRSLVSDRFQFRANTSSMISVSLSLFNCYWETYNAYIPQIFFQMWISSAFGLKEK